MGEGCTRNKCKKNIIKQIMDRKLNLFEHICRMKDNRLVKEVMFGTMEGEVRRGRPCSKWLDDIKEWGGKEIHLLNRKAQVHGTWRTVVRTALDTYAAVLSKKSVTTFFLLFELGPQSVLHTNPTHWYRVRKAYLNSRLRY